MEIHIELDTSEKEDQKLIKLFKTQQAERPALAAKVRLKRKLRMRLREYIDMLMSTVEEKPWSDV